MALQVFPWKQTCIQHRINKTTGRRQASLSGVLRQVRERFNHRPGESRPTENLRWRTNNLMLNSPASPKCLKRTLNN